MPRSLPTVVRNDPVPNALPGQEIVYETIQSLWSAWARLRYRRVFERVRTFCLFVGYPRSGHSLVGAMLNAHRHAVISHELNVSRLVLAGHPRNVLFSRILARASWFNLKGNRSNYEYQIPNQWQGRFESIRVIGDKRGGSVAQVLEQHPDFLQRICDQVQVPLRFVHVVRNPFDNIAAISIWHRLSMEESIDYYFSLCRTVSALRTRTDPAEMITIHHEDFIRTPEAALTNLCAFLGLEPTADYLADCSSIVFEQPTHSRRRVSWSAAQRMDVEARLQEHAHLHRYQFEIAEDHAK